MDHKIAETLEAIKRLLILDLVNKGVQSQQIAKVLEVDNATVTRIVSVRKLRKA